MRARENHYGALILVIGGLSFIAYCLYQSLGNRPSRVKQEYNYQTEVRIKSEYSPIDLSGMTIKPAVITHYTSSPDFENNRLVCREDSLLQVINNLKRDTVFISPQFLTQFPSSPKLVDLSLTYDSISLGLLNTDAELMRKTYPLDFTHYTYQASTLDGYTFNATELSRKKSFGAKPFRVMGFTGYSVMDSKIVLGAQADYSLGPWSLSARPRFALSDVVSFQLDLTANYPLIR